MVLGLSLAKWGREEAQAQSPDCSNYANVTNTSNLPTECYCAQVGAVSWLEILEKRGEVEQTRLN